MPSSNPKWPEQVRLVRRPGTFFGVLIATPTPAPGYEREYELETTLYVPLTALQEVEEARKAERAGRKEERSRADEAERRAIEAEAKLAAAREEVAPYIASNEECLRLALKNNDPRRAGYFEGHLAATTVILAALDNSSTDAATLADSDPPEETTHCKPVDDNQRERLKHIADGLERLAAEDDEFFSRTIRERDAAFLRKLAAQDTPKEETK